MSIDGIGRPPVPPAAGGPTQGASAPASGEGAFQVQKGSSVAPTAKGLLERLERGELSVEQYLDSRVDEAIAPFQAHLSPEKLDFMKNALRAQLESDPVLIELVRRATEGLGSGSAR